MKRILPVIFFALLILLSIAPLCVLGAEVQEGGETLPSLRFKSDSPLIPYVGGGILPGDEQKKADYLSLDPSATVDERATYVLATGLDCAVGENSSFNLGYRYSPARLPGFLELPIIPESSEEESHLLNFNLKLAF